MAKIESFMTEDLLKSFGFKFDRLSNDQSYKIFKYSEDGETLTVNHQFQVFYLVTKKGTMPFKTVSEFHKLISKISENDFQS